MISPNISNELDDFYGDLLALPTDPIFLFNFDGQIAYTNQAAQELLINNKRNDQHINLFDTIKELKPIYQEFISYCDTLPKLCKINIAPLADQEKIIRMFATDRGLGIALLEHQSDHSGNEKGLENAVKFFKSAIDDIADCCLITLAEPLNVPGPVIIYANKASVHATGYSNLELMGKSPRLFQSKGTDSTTLKNFGSSLRLWQPSTMEILNYRKDKTKHWVELKASPSVMSGDLYTHWISIQRDTSERVRDEEKLSIDASTDSLTGLTNRRYFIKELELLSRTKNSHFALFYCDVDNFKLLNDGFGHDYGDYFLKEVANQLKDSVRDGDLIARIGGDEFAVLTKRIANNESILEVSRRLNEKLNQLSTQNPKALASKISVSIGVAMKLKGETGSAQEFLQKADNAMYFAKTNHKGSCAFYDDHLEKISSRTNYIQELIRKKLSEEDLIVAYQPLINLTDGKTHGAEALVRMAAESNGETIMPGEFIPLAEQSGAIGDIEEYCINNALSVLKKIQASGLKRKISVNISPAHLSNIDISELIVNLNKQHGCDISDLIVEITETVVLKKSDLIRSRLNNIKKIGVKIALDDFGTGYSSIEWLLGGLIDIVKLDVEFTKLMVTDQKARVVVKCLAQTCKELGIQVVAEGIETALQHNILEEIGYKIGQGYLFGKAQKPSFLYSQ